MFNEDLYTYAKNKNITVDIRKIPKNKSFSVHIFENDFIVIDEDAMNNSSEERTHLAHELGHCETGAFYSIESSLIQRDKAEKRADRWAIKKLINKDELKQQLKNGMEIWDLADYFNVTEDYIKKAYHLYFEIEKSA